MESTKRSEVLRLSALMASIVGLGGLWWEHGWPNEPYFILLFAGFISIGALLWSIGLSLDNITHDLSMELKYQQEIREREAHQERVHRRKEEHPEIF